MENFFNDAFEFSIFKKALKATDGEPVVVNLLSSDESLVSEAKPSKLAFAPQRKNMSEKFGPSPYGKYFGARNKRTAPVDMSDFSAWKNKNYRKVEETSYNKEQGETKTFSLSDFLKNKSTKQYSELDQAKSNLKKPITQMSSNDPDYKKFAMDSYMHKLEEGIIAKDKFKENEDLLEPISSMSDEDFDKQVSQDEDFSSSSFNFDENSFDDIGSGESFSLDKKELDEVKSRLERIEREANNIKEKPNRAVITGDELKDDEDKTFSLDSLIDDDELDENAETSEQVESPIVSAAQSSEDEADEEKKTPPKKYYEVNLNEEVIERKAKEAKEQAIKQKEISQNSEYDEISDDNLKSDETGDLGLEEGALKSANEDYDGDFDEDKEPRNKTDEETSQDIEENNDAEQTADIFETLETGDEETSDGGGGDGETETEKAISEMADYKETLGNYDLDEADDYADEEVETEQDIQPIFEGEPEIEPEPEGNIDDIKSRSGDFMSTETNDNLTQEFISRMTQRKQEKAQDGTSEQAALSVSAGEDDALWHKKSAELEEKINDLQRKKQEADELAAQKLKIAEENNKRVQEDYQSKLKGIEETYSRKYEEIKERMYRDRLDNERRFDEFKSSLNETKQVKPASNMNEIGKLYKKQLKSTYNISNLESDKKLLQISNKFKADKAKSQSQTDNKNNLETDVVPERQTKRVKEQSSKTAIAKPAAAKVAAKSKTARRRRSSSTRRKIDSDIIGSINFD